MKAPGPRTGHVQGPQVILAQAIDRTSRGLDQQGLLGSLVPANTFFDLLMCPLT